MKTVYFAQMCYEPAQQVQQMIAGISAHDPDARIVLVNEGIHREDIDQIRMLAMSWMRTVEYVESPRLKYPQRNGATWFNRMYWLLYPAQADWVIKIDPDTVVRKPLTIFPDVDAFGHIHHAGTDAEHIQGGCHVLRYSSLAKLLPFAHDPKFTNTDNYVPVNFRNGFRQTGEVSYDFSFIEMARMAGDFSIGSSPEIESYQKAVVGHFDPLSKIIHPVRIKVDNT